MTAPRLRSRAMTEQAAQAAVDQACRSLRLPTIRARVEEIAAAAQREQLSPRKRLARRGGRPRGGPHTPSPTARRSHSAA
jgi:hypothetical protein